MINTASSGLGQGITVSRRRSNIEIIADMLRIGESGAGKTKIMYNANMSYGQIQKYLGFLVSQGFIDKMEMDNEVGSQMVTYQLTESGLKLLQLINNLMEMLGTGEGDKV